MMSLAMTPALAAGRVVDRRDDLHQAVFHRDLDAEAAELAAGLHLHVAEALRIHVARMRIEPGEHAIDRRFDELAVVGLLDVIGAHPLEHVAEQIELPVRVRRPPPWRSTDEHRCGCVASNVSPAPATAPRKIREVLRIIREPFRLRLLPTMGWDRSERRLCGTPHRVPVAWASVAGRGGYLRSAAHHRYGFTGQNELAEIDG